MKTLLNNLILLANLFIVKLAIAQNFAPDFIPEGLTIEQTNLKQIVKIYKLKSGDTSSLGLSHFAYINSNCKLILGIDEPYILRGVNITYPLNEFDKLNEQLIRSYGFPRIDKSALKTFFVDDMQIELSKTSSKTVLEITSIKLRNERIEVFKILARKGYPLYQSILRSIDITY